MTEFRRRPFEYETSFAIDELRVRLDGGENLDLLVKDVGAGLSPAGAQAKPSFTLDPRREIAVYREVLSGGGLSTPRFHGAWLESGGGGAWLFLERVAGEVLTDIGEPEIWQGAAAWSARLDAAVASRPATADTSLLHRDAGWHRHWLDMAATALADEGREGASSLAEQLRINGDTVIERLEAIPKTFVHGELYPSNVLIERDSGAARVAPVDWELAGTGPYALDLAALVSGWDERGRLSMIEAFRDALPEERRRMPLERVVEETDLCRLALALQWLGWAPGWEAPGRQRHDWAREATELLGKVGVA